jgi:hypothetical protein
VRAQRLSDLGRDDREFLKNKNLRFDVSHS